MNVVPYLIDSYQKLSIYKKPLIQMLVFLIGFLLASIIAKYDYRKYMGGAIPYLFALIAILSLLAVFIKKLITGKAVDRWLFGGSIQPLEFAKIALLIFLSYYIVRKGNLRQWKHLFWALLFPIITALLLLTQPDKGGAVFILLMTALMVYVGGVPKKAYLLILAVFFFFIYYILTSKGYVAERLSAWRDPFVDPEDSGYQIIQSLYALARGGIMGVGIGQGLQKLGPLPASDTDYVIAVVGEEMGFVGVFVIIILYAILVGRLLWYALMSKGHMEKLLLFGTAMNFAISFLWNLAMVSNLIPPKGIALPLVSYGSSNLFASLILLGIAQSVINHQERSLSSPLRTSPTPTILKHA
ncbi:FtsW/RodA/SpoVE family cell cycle protein [Hydrogenobacter sp. T-2]|uniref:FtsW/RodA/SpoVE family cell cycle protein n=1 Tax=Pampinifervens diazotrophicum TaxID=1632018 RepID=UPI002B25A4E8|nr:FtsW/RodA/SpoVE family cell cycle protein [Hydrogenobacter sp. T-2]WPM31771.1 FtsW/RodA/SpoVE family cell cycle protein [Hydrogenobacter sp. T-2]